MTKLIRSMKTALHQAVSDQRLHQVRLLIKQQVNVNIQDLYGQTPLMVACSLDDDAKAMKFVRILTRAGSSLHIYDDFHRSALSYAALNGLLNVTVFLLQKDSCTDFATVDCSGNTLMHMAAESGNPELVNFILDDMKKYHHYKIDIPNDAGFTPFLLACKNSNFASAYILLTKGKSCMNVRDDKENMNAIEWINVGYKRLQPISRHVTRNKKKVVSSLLSPLKLSGKYTMYRRPMTPKCRHVNSNKQITFAGSSRRVNNVHSKQKETFLQGFVDAREALLAEIAKVNTKRRPPSADSNSSSVQFDLTNHESSTERIHIDVPHLFQMYSEQILENNTRQLSALTLTNNHLQSLTLPPESSQTSSSMHNK
ncbi:putative ankyrin repeat protein RBE_0997 isoform X1 [Argonauta hians]